MRCMLIKKPVFQLIIIIYHVGSAKLVVSLPLFAFQSVGAMQFFCQARNGPEESMGHDYNNRGHEIR